jgi:hypothetical protein
MTPPHAVRITPATEPEVDRKRALLLSEQKALDKMIIAGAAGALVVSSAFLEKIAPHPALDTAVFLVVAWTSLGLSLLSAMASYSLSVRGIGESLRALSEYANTGKADLTATARVNLLTHIANIGSRIFLMVGVAALVMFAFLNVPFVG